MNFKDYWDNVHKEHLNDKLTYDNWLDNYLDIIKYKRFPILDLGCGLGNNALYLKEKGFDVVCLDYSEVALENISKQFKDVKVIKSDISMTLPFEDNSFDLIIADLSLHYFDSNTTIKIMKELRRILIPGGHLIARVNSINDVNYGAKTGKEIEEHYYYVNGYNKRFFSLIDVVKFFGIIGDVKIKETILYRYEKPKYVYELLIENLK